MLIKKIASKRMAILRISVILIIIFIILDNNFSAYTLDIDLNTSVLFSCIGFTFVVLGGFGRIWASLYLEGFKTKKLIKEGNSLYNDSSYNMAEMKYRKSLEKDHEIPMLRMNFDPCFSFGCWTFFWVSSYGNDLCNW